MELAKGIFLLALLTLLLIAFLWPLWVVLRINIVLFVSEIIKGTPPSQPVVSDRIKGTSLSPPVVSQSLKGTPSSQPVIFKHLIALSTSSLEEQENMIGDLLEEFSEFDSKSKGYLWLYKQVLKSVLHLVYRNVKNRLTSYFGERAR